MVKLYFKKLLSMLFYIALDVLIYYISYSILATIANFFENSIIRYGVLMGIPVVIICVIVCKRRIKNIEIKQCYLESINNTKPTFKTEIRYIFKFPHFLTELFSFATIVSPIVIVLGIESNASFWKDIFAGSIVLSVIVGIFFVLDFISWVIVHTYWRKV